MSKRQRRVPRASGDVEHALVSRTSCREHGLQVRVPPACTLLVA